ncbi:hypothetical protein Gotri_021430, partial [Gossypium trilobum]|nr:hypothetical protein [Gossypium trilobum]
MSYMRELYKLGKNILVRRLKDAMWRLPKWSKTVMNDNIPLTFAMKVLACIQTAQMGLGMGLPVVE